MKKLLLTTTALGLLAASAANAGSPTVKVGGHADFQVGFGSQENLFENQSNAGVADGSDNSIFARDLHTRADTSVTISVDGKADNGLGYGAFIELNADTSASEDTAADRTARRTYIYTETGFGRTEFGSTGDAGDALRVDASTLARATGGIGGDFTEYVDLGSGAIAAGATYYITPGLPSAVGLPGEQNHGYGSGGAAGALATNTNHDRANANKISYYSPRIHGLQAGISYTPDQGEHGNAEGFSSANGGGTNFIDVWNAGLNYEKQYDAVSVAASLTGEWGEAKDSGTTAATIDDLRAYAIGATISHAGFTIGGSWAKASEYGAAKAFGSDLRYWTLGGSYEFGPVAASITYFDSNVENATSANAPDQEFRNLSLGLDYKLAPGFMPYIEVSFFETDDNVADTATTADNEGSVILVGTQLNF